MAAAVFTIFIAVTIFASTYTLPTSITFENNWSVNKQNVAQNENLFEGDILLPPLKARALALLGNGVRWSNGIVPYEFAPGYTADQQAAIVSRMRKLESLVALNNVRCVQFQPRVSSDLYYITIRNQIGCYSSVGQNTGVAMERTVSLLYPGCFDDGRTMHELLHVLGFYHEQSRPDRDSYVKVNWANIQAGKENDFTKYGNTVVNTYNMPYDYTSVMHYGKTDFSNNSLPTIEPLQPNVKIGQRYKLSPADIQEIQLFYGCTATGPTLPPTTTPTTPATPDVYTSIYSSQLTSNNGIYTRDRGFAANYYYETIQVTVPMSGSYRFQCDSYLDSFASVYYSPFNPSNPAANLVASFDDRSSDNWEFDFTLNFPAAYTVILVVTTYSPNVVGPFSVIATGPAKVTFTRISSTVNPIGRWYNTSSLVQPRFGHTASLLINGKVLLTGGWFSYKYYLNSAELYDPSAGTWAAVANMNTARQYHTASVLTNGKVLVTGGQYSVNSTELYDPSAGTWTIMGNLNQGRGWHTASVLSNGKVLVTGGDNGIVARNSAELFDPATGTWTFTGNMNFPRSSHTASVLTNGKVLVTGGVGGSGTAITQAELYDPSTRTWTTTGSMSQTRYGHIASVLINGKVLVTGGVGAAFSALNSAELYDPSTGTWTTAGVMNQIRKWHTSSVLTDGKVLVIGGSNDTLVLNSAELYDPLTRTWTPAVNMNYPRYYPTSTVLTNGKVLVAGGFGNASYPNTAELYY